MRRRSIFFGALPIALACGGSPANTDGGATDATVVGCAPTYAGCTAKSTTDDTAAGYFEIGIVTSSSLPSQYSPSCVRIKVGQTIGIAAGSGDPLASSTCSPTGPLPLPTMPATGTMNYTFTTSGNYGYHSTTHGADDGSGMSGLIVVE